MYLHAKQAADFLGVCTATLKRWELQGKLKPKRNRKNKYRLYSVQQLMEADKLRRESYESVVLKPKARVVSRSSKRKKTVARACAKQVPGLYKSVRGKKKVPKVRKRVYAVL
jgi:DNA-binding transcriptional MerR regulator